MYEITMNDCNAVIMVFEAEEPCKILRVVSAWDYYEWLQGCN